MAYRDKWGEGGGAMAIENRRGGLLFLGADIGSETKSQPCKKREWQPQGLDVVVVVPRGS